MQRKAQKKWFYFGNIAISLGIGTAVYVLFRPDTYLAHWGNGFFHAYTNDISGVIRRMENTAPALVLFFRNFASDMLWAYALFFAVSFIEEGRKAVIYATLFAAGIEVFQGCGMIAGTFDLWDIWLEWLAIAAAWLVEKQNVKKQQGEIRFVLEHKLKMRKKGDFL